MVRPTTFRQKAVVAAALSGLATITVAGIGMAGADAASQAAPPPQPTLAQSRALAASGAAKLVSGRPAALHAGTADKFIAHPVISSAGKQYVPYTRTYNGLPVVGGDFVVQTDARGNVEATSSALDHLITGLGTKASVSSKRAAALAEAKLLKVASVSRPRLVVHALGTPRLAWETRVSGVKGKGKYRQLSRQSVYVDARTGKVISAKEHIVAGEGTGHYNGPNPLTINTSGSGSEFSMTDPNIKNLACQDAANEQTFTGPDDKWGDGDGKSKETGCADTLYAAQTEAKMLKEWLGRDGQDGEGGAWPIRVGLDDVNAYYDGFQVQIGHNQAGDWISSMDVVGHELGHGIDDHTPGGISNNGTQEFIADTFGAMTEAYANQPADFDEPDFLVGEEIDLVGSGPIRNMYDPSQVNGDPNCYSDDIPDTEVHSAAGPGNHWFYLLAQGNKPSGGPESPTCNTSDVTGVGIEKAAKILYNAMLLKTSDSSYLKYRTWTLTAAKTLFAGSCTEFDTVKAAWDAVSVPAQSDDPTCDGSDPTPSPTTSPTDPTPSPTDPTPTDPTTSPTDPTPSPTDPTPTDPTTSPTQGGDVDFTGVAALSNCSASVIRFEDSQPTDPALGLTNGHCYEGGMPEAGQVIVDQPSSRQFTLLGTDGQAIGDVNATKVLYSTMTKTDVTLYQLGKTYQELADEFSGFTPLTLAKESPADGRESKVVSGYWQKIYDCSVDHTVYQLKEADWTMERSIKYKQPGCDTIGGTSGSPVVATDSHEVIGINNTGNEDGERCAMNNPCEVDENGNVTVDQGAAYGQQTAWFYTCLTADHTLDLTKEGCELPAPQALRAKRQRQDLSTQRAGHGTTWPALSSYRPGSAAVGLGAGRSRLQPGEQPGQGVLGHRQLDGAAVDGLDVDDHVTGVGDQGFVAHRAAVPDPFQPAAVQGALGAQGQAEDTEPLQLVTDVPPEAERPAAALVGVAVPRRQPQAAIERAAVPGDPATAARESDQEQHTTREDDPDCIEEPSHLVPTPFLAPSRAPPRRTTMFNYAERVSPAVPRPSPAPRRARRAPRGPPRAHPWRGRARGRAWPPRGRSRAPSRRARRGSRPGRWRPR